MASPCLPTENCSANYLLCPVLSCLISRLLSLLPQLFAFYSLISVASSTPSNHFQYSFLFSLYHVFLSPFHNMSSYDMIDYI
ncbi:uncharacterized protein BKA55DRAFT_554883 [Fusarium redolens]|uniref:Uncharacterized protein n=1 Tax=Fusarium redolens TaxID=48865 RepID=A0A9P9R6G4_FUSRE|nr:uncharacterized protein BKA55DRAFT_554883 [Fusarium redolens]KAH7267233.1 hypothetical protein BKA55DRAFT_554883 [Fusarium redolens]